MMKMNEIRTEVVKKLQDMLQDENVSLEEVDIVKLNDIFQYGIAFQRGDIGKTLYINDFLSDGKTADDIADEMLVAYESSVDAPPWELIRDIQSAQSLESLANNLFVSLLEVARNENYLQQIPYLEVGNGFAYIAQIRHMDSSGNGFMAATVTHSLAETNEWDIEEVFDLAISNTLTNAAPMLLRMEDTLLGIPNNLLDEEFSESAGMFILTNADQTFGAASLFLPGIIDKIHACLGNSFYAIPSSIHEFLIIPESMEVNIDDLSGMCREANATVVDRKDVLSDHVLHFPME